jgi:hypothetical protein
MTRTTVLGPNRSGKDASDLEIGLRRQVVGQDEAIEQIARVYQIHRTGLSPEGRPIRNFLFLGPTGSGKTRVVEATAQAPLGNPKAVVTAPVRSSAPSSVSSCTRSPIRSPQGRSAAVTASGSRRPRTQIS